MNQFHTMKKDSNLLAFVLIIIAVLALIYFSCNPTYAQGHIPNNVVKYPGYTAYWNPSTLIPDSVIWIEQPHKKIGNRSTGFHATGGRPNLTKDYAHSGYDIGHNCDASDENGNTTDEYNSFDFVNTYPQRPNCNRLTWLALENYTRSISVPVKVKVSYMGSIGGLMPDGVMIPRVCVKELWYGDGIHPGFFKYEKYIIPNNDTVNRHLFTYYRIK